MNALVKRAQEIIESNNPAKYYDIYKKHEVGYWSRIPEMIVDYNEVRFVDNVLDVGAAYGTLLMFTHLNVPHCNLYAIDNVPYMSLDLMSTYDITHISDNIENLQWEPPVKFDCIIFTEILEHLNFNPVDTLKRLYDLLTPSGVIFLSTPNALIAGTLGKYATWQNMPTYSKDTFVIDAHIHHYTLAEISEICRLAGFKIDKCEASDEPLNHLNLQLSKQRSRY
jgi:2-polyprenyl-3-methyl-5-hydroxy-6-metoxy-1,4-benzoquinol methylase